MEVCKVCGELLNILTNVHCQKHGLTKDEYRKQYGKNLDKNFRLPKKIEFTEVEKYEMNKTSKLCRA